MPRPAPTHRLFALAIVIALLAGCTGINTSTAPTPSSTGSPTTSATSQATPTTSPSPSSAGSTRPTPSPSMTVPPVSKELLAEATTVFTKITERTRLVSIEGGFAQDDVHPDYPKYLMGGALMNAIMTANYWHDEGRRRISGSESLMNVRPYPAMTSNSLVALTGCLRQTDVEIRDSSGYGTNGSNEQLIVYLKRDSDGQLKIFERDYLRVDDCNPATVKPALVAEATKIFNTVFGLFEKHLGAGGLSHTDYPTSGFGPYLSGEARNRILWELEHFRVNGEKFAVTGPPTPVFVTEWPRALDKSVVSITGCFARTNITFVHADGTAIAQGPRIYFAHFTHDKAGKLRMSSLDWIYADACG